MKTRASLPLCLLILPVTLTAFQASDQTPGPVRALLARADSLATVAFDNAGALDLYKQAENLDSSNYEMLWGTSRCYIDIGEHLPAKTDQERQAQLDHYQKALDYANRAIAVSPKGSEGYTRRAIANGRVALFKGVWESLDLVKSVKTDIEKAIALDPKNSTAYYILGRTHAKVSEKPRIIRWPLGLGWASYEDAAENYEKAIALRPDFVMYRLDAARTYVELEEFAKARKHLDAIPSIRDQDEDDGKFRQEARDLAQVIAGEK